jgi:hypothetical protein
MAAASAGTDEVNVTNDWPLIKAQTKQQQLELSTQIFPSLF